MIYGVDATQSVHGGILINVEPLQAAFFAGESFSARITFTNSHPAVSPSDQRQLHGKNISVPERPATATGVTFKHKRAAHSITYGSAPLANPPTSPGTPNYSTQFAMSTPTLSSASLTARPLVGKAALPPPRKGLIGVVAGKGSALDELNGIGGYGRTKPYTRRSLSVDVGPGPSKGALPPGAIVSGDIRYGSQRMHPPSPLSRSRIPSAPLESGDMSRSTSMPIPTTHPHARKQSVIDGHITNETYSEYAPSSLSSSTSAPSPLSSSLTSSVPPSPTTGGSSSSGFSLGLDPITETPPNPAISTGLAPNNNSRDRSASLPGPISSAGMVLHSPKPSKPNQTNQLIINSRVRAGSVPHVPSSLGLGQPKSLQVNSALQPTPMGRSATMQNPPPLVPKTAAPGRSTFSSTFSVPNTEVVLWSYAQLLGTFELDETGGLVLGDASAALRGKLNALRSDGIIGGGRMDIGAPVTPSPLSVGSRTRRGFISSFLGGTSSAPPSPVTPGSSLGLGFNSLSSLWSSPAPSPMSPSFSINGNGAGVSSPMVGVSGGLPVTALPTFETQPSMLAIDLNLAPGESRTFTYTVPLPAVLPPTFRGRAMKFSYHLVIGSSRAANFLTPATPNFGGGGGQSKIMRVPIRLYNHVSVERPPIPYDLLWPVARRKSGPVKTSMIEDPPELMKQLVPMKRVPGRGNPEQFEQYAKRLLTLSTMNQHQQDETDDDSKSAAGTVRQTSGRNAMISPSTTLGSLDEELNGVAVTCRESVEMLTRVSRKMSYDITKDGVKVAVLTFIKSAFRLGESVMGVVEVNPSSDRARVLKFSAMLEAQEVIPERLADVVTSTSQNSFTKSRGLKRTHAEHHSSMVIDSQRVPFALDIPSDASPGFRVSMEDGAGSGGLEWRVRICFLVAVGPSDPTRHLIRDGNGGDWGASWKAAPTLAPLTEGTDGIIQRPSTWSIFSSTRDTDQDLEGWSECMVEVVECEVGITVWPGNTLYRPTQLSFDV